MSNTNRSRNGEGGLLLIRRESKRLMENSRGGLDKILVMFIFVLAVALLITNSIAPLFKTTRKALDKEAKTLEEYNQRIEEN